MRVLSESTERHYVVEGNRVRESAAAGGVVVFSEHDPNGHYDLELDDPLERAVVRCRLTSG